MRSKNDRSKNLEAKLNIESNGDVQLRLTSLFRMYVMVNWGSIDIVLGKVVAPERGVIGARLVSHLVSLH